jgi:predicted house-cleaning noncanonical NTP pyrophosphatase (MazG superfamily)
MAKYNKLVRDRIPEILDAKGVEYSLRIASEEELEERLLEKLLEEVQEFFEHPNVEELGDILEVIKALEKLPQYADLEAVRLLKREERGGFEKRIILQGDKSK